MIKKIVLFFFAVVGLSQHAAATNGFWLEKRDGTKMGYLFEQQINISCTPSSLVITTADATVEHDFDDVRRIFFDESITTLTPSVLQDLQQQVRLAANGVEIKGFAAGTPVTLADLSGRVVMRRATDDGGQLFISKAELSQGIYIIKVDKTAIKFNNK